MKSVPAVLTMIVILLMPVYASAQSTERIIIFDDFGTLSQGEPLFIYGKIAAVTDDAYLIVQIFNPDNILCQIQQLLPLPDGSFATEVISLKDRLCGIVGQYEVRLFYGDYVTTTEFNVAPVPYNEPTNIQKLAKAQELVNIQAFVIDKEFDTTLSASNVTLTDLESLKDLYVDRWHLFYDAEFISEFSPEIRPAIKSSTSVIGDLLDAQVITIDDAEAMDKLIYTSIFYNEIGDKLSAVSLLASVFANIIDFSPEKVNAKTPTFEDVEDSLLNLMKKSNTVMSKNVKKEIGFIFARGTGPVYSDEISIIIDILSKSGYLDTISRNDAEHYRSVQTSWDSLKSSLHAKNTISELVASHSRVADLHQAAILLRQLDNVERFITKDVDQTSTLANLIRPDWNQLSERLTLSTSVEKILELKDEVNQMTQIIEISSRIDKIVKIAQAEDRVDPVLIANWRTLLDQVDDANSAEDVLRIVSEFDQSIKQIREKRDPIPALEFQYKTMKAQAELQDDQVNLYFIENALKILKIAKQEQTSYNAQSDGIEVLLSWVSTKSVSIQSSLDEYNSDTYKVRASYILEKAKSLQNLIEISLTTKSFLPKYIEFTDNLNQRISNVQNLVVNNELNVADSMIDDLLDEWILVSKAYTDAPHSSNVGYSLDELKRIELREKLDGFDNTVDRFWSPQFSIHQNSYNQLVSDARHLIDIANFIDAEIKLVDIGNFVSEFLKQTHADIRFNVEYDSSNHVWVLSGTTKKTAFDTREDLHVNVTFMDGTIHSELEFSDTRHGNFQTSWIAPTVAGLYVVEIHYRDAIAIQVIYIQDKFETKYSDLDESLSNVSHEYNELLAFAEKFGGSEFTSNSRFAAANANIKASFTNKTLDDVSQRVDQYKFLIERYLPVKSPFAVIDASFANSKLVLTGAVKKEIKFSETIFVDIYNQQGIRQYEIIVKDSPEGVFNQVVNLSLPSGTYVAQLEYHDILVNDFFTIR